MITRSKKPGRSGLPVPIPVDQTGHGGVGADIHLPSPSRSVTSSPVPIRQMFLKAATPGSPGNPVGQERGRFTQPPLHGRPPGQQRSWSCPFRGHHQQGLPPGRAEMGEDAPDWPASGNSGRRCPPVRPPRPVASAGCGASEAGKIVCGIKPRRPPGRIGGIVPDPGLVSVGEK